MSDPLCDGIYKLCGYGQPYYDREGHYDEVWCGLLHGWCGEVDCPVLAANTDKLVEIIKEALTIKNQ